MKKYYFIALSAMCFMLAFLPVTLNAAGPPTVDVNVINTPSVNIVNPEASPVPIKNVENPAKSPFIMNGVENFKENIVNMVMNLEPLVPSDKRMVIEHISVHCDLDSDDSIPRITISINQDLGEGSYTIYQFPLVVQKLGNTFDGKVGWAVSQQVRLYTDGISGTPTFINIYHQKLTATSYCYADISGYTIAR